MPVSTVLKRLKQRNRPVQCQLRYIARPYLKTTTTTTTRNEESIKAKENVGFVGSEVLSGCGSLTWARAC